MPDWLIRGRTVLIPKAGSTGSPDQYRPITCLNTMYKLFTSVLTRILMHHVSSKNLLPEEQKALRSKTRSYLDALVIDAAVAQESKTYRRNLSVAWIGYKKAYDMVPHQWLHAARKSIRAPKQVRRTVRRLATKWETSITLKTVCGNKTEKINLQRGLGERGNLSNYIPAEFKRPPSERSHDVTATAIRDGFQELPRHSTMCGWEIHFGYNNCFTL